ncbi:uncharacterized protein PHACADRAFT_204904, partial [Phanerochaete carnosa HHB-10118-sp]
MRRLKKTQQSSETKDAANTAAGALKQALEIFSGVASNLGVPGVQIGVSVLSTLLDLVQKSHANTESINDLAEKVGDLTTVIGECTKPHGQNIPGPMQARLDRLFTSWKAIDDKAQILESRRRIQRELDISGEADKIAGIVKDLSWSIQCFMLEGTVAVESTLNRLESRLEVKSLPPFAALARFDSSREECTTCLEGTRTGILEDIYTWATNQHVPDDTANSATQPASHQSNVFWLNGQPGSGKTTIARTVASRCHAEGILGASFFCSRSDAECNNASLIFTTIAYQLGLLFPSYGDRVSEILKKDPLLAHSAVTRQFEELIIQPLAHLRDLHNDGSPIPPCVVVIDALDECRDPKATSAILSSLLKHADKLSPLRFFVASRPERHIIATFNFPGYRNAFGQLPLHEVELEVVTPDINHYITVSFSKIAESLRVPKSWPNKLHVEKLGLRSNGLFIFAATAVKYVGDPVYGDPVGRLERLMSATAEAGPHQLLDELYLQVLETAFPDMSDD